MQVLNSKEKKEERLETGEGLGDVWAVASQVATVGIFIILLGACLYVSHAILTPIVAALVIGTTLAPLVKFGARRGVSPWITAIALGLGLLIIAATAVTLLAKPTAELIARAPEIGAGIRQKLYFLDRPLAAVREFEKVFAPAASPAVAVESSQLAVVTPLIAYVTPAVAQLILFFVVLIFFLATQLDFRRYMVSFFTTREAKLRFMRIVNDVERNLTSYVAVVTVINVCLGVVVGVGAWLFGYPTPILFGLMAAVFNYVPYVGAACTTAVLFGVALVTFPSFGYALLPPAAFVALATLEGQFITPTMLGRHFMLSPLAVLLALAFWSWLWGPIGTFLAVPLTMIGLIALQHIFPPDESRLPP
jgi:predicted PurR-regulated permease PerM